LSNVLEAAGYGVHREYYVNDAGNQMRAYYRSLYARYMQAAGHDVSMPQEGYHGDYLKQTASEILEEEGGDRYVQMPEEEAIREFGKIGLARALADIKTDLEVLGVTFD
jgi:arginyl-tRNA synthetase